MTLRALFAVLVSVVVAMSATACGGSSEATGDGQPTVVVTTSILGDVVTQVVGDRAEVVVVMPAGVNAHVFQPSPRDVAAIRDATVVVANGGGFEESLVDVLKAARSDGVAVIEALDGVEAHGGHEGPDPHFFTDPARMSEAVVHLSDSLAEHLPGFDPSQGAADLLRRLEDLDAQVEALVADLAPERRLLVTDHPVLESFADRYGFEVVGAVYGDGAHGGASAADVDHLAREVERRNIPAVFTEWSADGGVVDALAAEAGGVEVVRLHTDSLGSPGSGAETYLSMVLTNARAIVEALA